MSYRNEKFLSLLGKNLDNLSDDELKKIAKDILDDSLHGLCFSLYEDGQGPGYEISDAQILRRLKILKPYTKWIRTFSSLQEHAKITKFAKELGFKTLVGAWLSSDDYKNKEEIQKILEVFCQKVTDVGNFGNGTIMKLIGNILNLVHNAVSAEVIGLGIKSGLDPKIIHDAISGTFSSSGVFENRGKLMVEEDYDKEGMNFSTPLKDSTFITDLSKKYMMPLPIYQVALQYYYAAVAQGHTNKDAASVLKAIEKNANIKRK